MGSVVSGYVAPDTTAATFGTRKGQVTTERWLPCGVCGYYYPESEFQVFEGKRYCRPHACYEDIESIIEKRLEGRNVPNDSERSDGI